LRENTNAKLHKIAGAMPMEKPKNVLITGGSGMIGTRLTRLLLEKGHNVSHLGRSKGEGIRTFLWDPSRKKIDARAISDVDAIVHLA